MRMVQFGVGFHGDVIRKAHDRLDEPYERFMSIVGEVERVVAAQMSGARNKHVMTPTKRQNTGEEDGKRIATKQEETENAHSQVADEHFDSIATVSFPVGRFRHNLLHLPLQLGVLRRRRRSHRDDRFVRRIV